jgi:hypothetical protein
MYRLKLLFDIAIREQCTKLITGDNCTKLAAQILSDMAQGKGAHVALECVSIIDIYLKYFIYIIYRVEFDGYKKRFSYNRETISVRFFFFSILLR